MRLLRLRSSSEDLRQSSLVRAVSRDLGLSRVRNAKVKIALGQEHKNCQYLQLLDPERVICCEAAVSTQEPETRTATAKQRSVPRVLDPPIVSRMARLLAAQQHRCDPSDQEHSAAREFRSNPEEMDLR